jgi:hypothetical protein
MAKGLCGGKKAGELGNRDGSRQPDDLAMAQKVCGQKDSSYIADQLRRSDTPGVIFFSISFFDSRARTAQRGRWVGTTEGQGLRRSREPLYTRLSGPFFSGLATA